LGNNYSEIMSGEQKNINWRFIVTITLPIILAVTGYVYTWTQERSDAQYKAQLERTNMQLREFYGPLYALVEAEEQSFQQFLRQTRPEVGMAFWTTENPPNKEQQEAWRRWINEVTMPNYLLMESIIQTRSDLLIEDEMPTPIIRLSAHIAGYKPVVDAWKKGDFSRNLSFFIFPQDVRTYLEHSYRGLKKKQKKLLGVIEGGSNKQIQSTSYDDG
jgi:hypothetical protein